MTIAWQTDAWQAEAWQANALGWLQQRKLTISFPARKILDLDPHEPRAGVARSGHGQARARIRTRTRVVGYGPARGFELCR